MNPLLASSKGFCGLALTLLVGMTSAGCYQGWKHPNAGGGPGGGSEKTGDGSGGSGQKPIGLAILDVVRPSPDAITNSNCGGVASSLSDLRFQEMELRAKAMGDLLHAKADVVRVVTSEISPADCAGFAALDRRAQHELPDLDVSQKLQDKPAVHVRLVLWYGDNSSYSPSQSVLNPRWADMRALEAQGYKRRLSVVDFALTGVRSGYIYTWSLNSRPDLTYNSRTVASPSADSTGVNEVMAAIRESTSGFSAWLDEKLQIAQAVPAR